MVRSRGSKSWKVLLKTGSMLPLTCFFVTSSVLAPFVVRPGAPTVVASDRSVRSDARSPVRSFLLLVFC